MLKTWPKLVVATALMTLVSGCLTGKLGTLSNHAPQTNTMSFDRELNLARLAERQDRKSEAIGLYEQVLSADATHPVALHRMGVMSAKAGRLDEALERLQAAREPDNVSAELLADIGFVQFRRGEFAAAETTLRQAQHMEPLDKRILNNLGLAIGMQGRFDEALVVFQQAGGNAEAVANIAYVRSQLGDLDGAIDAYHEALEYDGELKVAAQALVQLKHQPRKRFRMQPKVEEALALESADLSKTHLAVVTEHESDQNTTHERSEPTLTTPVAIRAPEAALVNYDSAIHTSAQETTSPVSPASYDTPDPLHNLRTVELTPTTTWNGSATSDPATPPPTTHLAETEQTPNREATAQDESRSEMELGSSWHPGNSSTWGSLSSD